MRLVCALILVGVLFVSVSGQQIPESSRSQGEEYRWTWQGEQAGSTSTRIFFPRISTGSDAIPIPGDTSLINTTGLGPHTIRHIQCMQINKTSAVPWIVWSPAFPEGVDTVYTNNRIPTFAISGVTIDSVEAGPDPGTSPFANLQLLASD